MLITGLLAYQYLSSAGRAPKVVERTVLTAGKTIPAHTLITAEMLLPASRPAEGLDPDALSAPAAAIGASTINDIPLGSVITTSKLVRGQAAGLTATLKPGQRAVTVGVDKVKGVANLLKPGDHVDVIAVIAASQEAPPRAVTFIRDATVLAVGTALDNLASPPPDGATTATLAVDARQADDLALADTSTTLRLALRDPRDGPRDAAIEPLHFTGPVTKSTSAPVVQPPPLTRQPEFAPPVAAAPVVAKPHVQIIDGSSDPTPAAAPVAPIPKIPTLPASPF